MNKNHSQIWNNCLSVIKDNIPKISFKTWFEPIIPLKLEDHVLTLQVPSHFFYEYLEEQYIDVLRKTLRKELGTNAKLEYNVVMENSHIANAKPVTVVVPGKSNANTRNRAVDMLFEKEEKIIRNPFVIPGVKKININSQLNSDYTFSNFVEGECNRLAYSAGCAVANNPGKTTFNPLVLYGNSGVGKTHLSQAIGLKAKEINPDKTILYVSADKFQTQYTEAIRNNNKNDFLYFYQTVDILIIDDVQELAGKEKTQNTFFHIFNHLHQSGKQLILTSDKAPVELKGMEERLLSRFKWGLSADLQNPDYETRVKILQQKAYKDGIVIPNEVIEYIATNVTRNVRELEGVLVSLLAQSTLNKKDLNLDLAIAVVGKAIATTKKEITIDSIQKIVCDHFKVPIEHIQVKTRKREVVQVRQVAMYFSKNLTKSSLATIGSQIGNKDHATVLHACKTINNLMDTDKVFRAQINEINNKLKV